MGWSDLPGGVIERRGEVLRRLRGSWLAVLREYGVDAVGDVWAGESAIVHMVAMTCW